MNVRVLQRTLFEGRVILGAYPGFNSSSVSSIYLSGSLKFTAERAENEVYFDRALITVAEYFLTRGSSIAVFLSAILSVLLRSSGKKNS